MSGEKNYIYDSTVKNKPWNSNALYLNINTFKEKQNNMTNAEAQLVLDNNTIRALNDVNGTLCINRLIQNWRNVSGAGDMFRNLGVNNLDAALTKEQKSIVEIDQANAGFSMQPMAPQKFKILTNNAIDVSRSKSGKTQRYICINSPYFTINRFLGDINSKTAKAAIAFDGYDSSVMPMAPQNYKTLKTLEGKLNGQVDPVTLDGLFDNDNLYRVLHGGGYSDAAILKMNYLQKITAAGEIAAMARKHPAPYDAFGQFGADQEDAFYANIFKIKAGSPLNSMDPSEALQLMKAHPRDYEKYIVVTDKEKYNWIKQMKCCRNLSDVQIVCNIMDMQTHGCSFMPTVSMIMDAYEGREEEFFKKFGFPMKTGDELNYDLLEILFYTEEKGAAHLNYEKGLETYAQCRLQYYSLHPEEYSARYKTPLYINGNQLDPMAYPRCLEQAQVTKNAGITDANFYGGSEGGTPDSIVNRTMHFLDIHRVLDVEFKDLGNSPSKEVLQEALNRGDRVFFEISNYELEDYYGNVLFKKGGGHQVDLIGITEDGRYELSTNGRRVFFDPKKTNGNFNRHLSYYAVSYRAPIDPPPVDDRRGQWNTDIGLNVDLSKAKV